MLSIKCQSASILGLCRGPGARVEHMPNSIPRAPAPTPPLPHTHARNNCPGPPRPPPTHTHPTHIPRPSPTHPPDMAREQHPARTSPPLPRPGETPSPELCPESRTFRNFEIGVSPMHLIIPGLSFQTRVPYFGLRWGLIQESVSDRPEPPSQDPPQRPPSRPRSSSHNQGCREAADCSLENTALPEARPAERDPLDHHERGHGLLRDVDAHPQHQYARCADRLPGPR